MRSAFDRRAFCCSPQNSSPQTISTTRVNSGLAELRNVSSINNVHRQGNITPQVSYRRVVSSNFQKRSCPPWSRNFLQIEIATDGSGVISGGAITRSKLMGGRLHSGKVHKLKIIGSGCYRGAGCAACSVGVGFNEGSWGTKGLRSIEPQWLL